ncbi:helix-turn-helix transcriptional regulator [Shimia sp. FJ5]|uniref:helix-turn-helix transcriptional regulator n=1 Tax=Shimia sp. FJ5 TaxID=3079054 RepID=UPI00262FBDB2|nr:LuxR C-terminal-related transcriptional regulator [Shimia sp. FJ5]MDV4146124.1 LuxR C-terminal-related transcriptional regulator [Shimia sp. FJ5]
MKDRTLKLVTLFLVSSVIFFLFDVASDIYDRVIANTGTNALDLIHLAFEIFSAVALLVAIKILVQRMLWLSAQNKEKAESLKFLRGEMDAYVREKFEGWALSPAERDIAMFMLKGLSISEIAVARSTAEGTVKAQTSSIFRKTGVTSRMELMSVFMDEFLDVGQALHSS